MNRLRSVSRGAASRDGFILIVVLGILVLITILVVGFLVHAGSQAKSFASYRDQTNNLLLSDVAVNMVKAQVDDATGISSGASPGLWASQPGAIRTVDGSGQQKTYKLYSSRTPTDTNTGTTLGDALVKDLPAATAVASNDWANSPVWTDLNAPALKSDGTSAYPIIDVVNDNADLPAGTTGSAPFASGNFNVVSDPIVNPVGAVRSATGKYPLPMPVQWLYVLKQGQVIAPDTTGVAGAQVTFNKASTVPTDDNPIVGRVAYWTDDDTCRVNVNTASVNANSNADGSTAAQGTFWDTPHFTAADDYSFALNQPRSLEYQRYPGHPATTTLALALPEFALGGFPTLGSGGTAEKLLGLTPRYTVGGSMEGTVAASGATTPLASTSKRLYASIGELLFDPPPTAQGSRSASTSVTKPQVEAAKFFLTAHSRAPELNLFGKPRVAIWPISSMNDPNHRTPSDQLIAFSSSTTPAAGSTVLNNYYFTRYPYVSAPTSSFTPAAATGSNSTNYDISLPGDPSNKFSNGNRNLLLYLDTLTRDALPGNLGHGSTFELKYLQIGKRQILTEMFDYVRVTNARDPGLDYQVTKNDGGVPGGVPYAAATAWDYNVFSGNGHGEILPTENVSPAVAGLPLNFTPMTDWAGTYGFGRYQGRIVEATIVFVGVGRGIPAGTSTYVPQSSPPWVAVTPQQAYTNTYPYPLGKVYAGVTPPPANTGTPNPNPGNPYIPPPGNTAVQAYIAFTFFDPALGYNRVLTSLDLRTLGLKTGFVATAGSPAVSTPVFPNEENERLAYLSNPVNTYGTYQGANPGSLGGLMDFRMMLAGRASGPQKIFSDNQYEAIGSIINMPTGGTFSFKGSGTGGLTVYMYGPGTPIPPMGSSSTIIHQVHTYNIYFPPATLPVPNVSDRPIFGTDNGHPSTPPPIDYQPRIVDPAILPGSTTAITDRFDDARSTSIVNGEYDCHMIDFANDTVISVVPNAKAGYGDYRMLCAPTTPLKSATGSLYSYTDLYNPTAANPNAYPNLFYGLRYPSGQVFPGAVYGSLVNGAAYYTPSTNTPTTFASLDGSLKPVYGSVPFVPFGVSNPTAGNDPGVPGGPPPDFDNGFGELPDGPYINLPDAGAVYPPSNNRVYYDNLGDTVNSTVKPSAFFSPQRQVPSPVMFGSLPTGAPVNGSTPKPWQTLLFQPGANGHAGLANPKDEYFLDLFWMPQAQPYAISEPFSTAGKVNLNYQILPFTYIDRSTAIQSVLSSEKVAEIGVTQAGVYKKDSGGGDTTGMTNLARRTLNLSEVDGTLGQFAAKFKNFDFFKAAAEICDVYLVPKDKSWPANPDGTNPTAQAEWYGPNFALVGDNTREKPYADIYSRITTKSNAFTVYHRVQTLKNPTSANPAQWTEGQGAILGDYRGSTTLERYIDPNDTTVPDYADPKHVDDTNLETHYKWRVVENTRFAP